MKQITKEQRYTIFSLKKQGCTQKFIAEAIGVHKSTISRELRRNVTEKGNYSYKVAQELADIRKLRLKEERKLTPKVKNRIERYMREKQWSPEQIVGYYKNKGYAIVDIPKEKQTKDMWIEALKQNGTIIKYLKCINQI